MDNENFKKKWKFLKTITDIISQYEFTALLESIHQLTEEDKQETFNLIDTCAKQVDEIFVNATTKDDILLRLFELFSVSKIENEFILLIIYRYTKDKNKIALCNNLCNQFYTCNSLQEIEAKIKFSA